MKLKNIKVLAMVMSAVLLTGCGKNAATKNDNNLNTGQVEETMQSTDDNTSYPVTIEHAFGKTIIESKPENVVAISWGNQDVALALGVVPSGTSKANYGQVNEQRLLAWTSEKYAELGVSNPVVFDDTDGLDFEAISDAKPDVILAAYSGLTEEEYKLLSEIAPVVAYPRAAWQTYWREQTLLDAQGMGLETEGKNLVAKTEELIKNKSSEYKDLEGKKAAFFYFNPADLGTFYVYMPTDPRAAYLEDLGLQFPESVQNLAGDTDSFSLLMSAENIDVLSDVDVIVTYGDETLLKDLQENALIGQIPAIKNGAVVMIDNNSYIAASCTPTVLSIPATIDEYLELLNDAAEKVK